MVVPPRPISQFLNVILQDLWRVVGAKPHIDA
jgi:hypothetical protein